MFDEASISAFQPSRRETIGAAILVAATLALPAPSTELHDDGDDFVMIDGWVFHRADLIG